MSEYDVAPSNNAATIADGFKAVMRRFASSVTILTTEHAGSRAGIIATACCSVSVVPPSIVVVVNRDSSAWSAIAHRGLFACNLLGDRHGFLIPPFSTSKTPAAQRFALGNWKEHQAGIPYLDDALGVLFCDVAADLTFGTHTLFVGTVKEALCPVDGAPLLWHNGSIATMGLAASARGRKNEKSNA